MKIFHLGASCVCRGARHSEYLFSIHDMNSICRFCKFIINILPQTPIIGSCFPTEIVFNEFNKRNWVVNHYRLIDGDYLDKW